VEHFKELEVFWVEFALCGVLEQSPPNTTPARVSFLDGPSLGAGRSQHRRRPSLSSGNLKVRFLAAGGCLFENTL